MPPPPQARRIPRARRAKTSNRPKYRRLPCQSRKASRESCSPSLHRRNHGLSVHIGILGLDWSCSSASDVVADRLVAGLVDKQTTFWLVVPYEDAELAGVVAHLCKVGLAGEVGEERAEVLLDAVLFALPESNLVRDGDGEEGIVAVHLEVGVVGEVGDDLLCGDAVGERRLDRVACDGADEEVGEARLDGDKEREDGDAERVGGVGGSGGGRGEGGGEAGGVEAAAGRLALVHEAVVTKVLEHVELRLGQLLGGVVASELETAEHKEEGEHLDQIHVALLGHVEVLEEQMPELRVDVLQEELEAAAGDVERCGGRGGARLHQVAPTQQIQHGFARRARLVAADHVVEDGLPLCARIVVEKGDVDGVLILGIARHAKRAMTASSRECSSHAFRKYGVEEQDLLCARRLELDDREAGELGDGDVELVAHVLSEPGEEVVGGEGRMKKEHVHDELAREHGQQPEDGEARRRLFVEPDEHRTRLSIEKVVDGLGADAGSARVFRYRYRMVVAALACRCDALARSGSGTLGGCHSRLSASLALRGAVRCVSAIRSSRRASDRCRRLRRAVSCDWLPTDDAYRDGGCWNVSAPFRLALVILSDGPPSRLSQRAVCSSRPLPPHNGTSEFRAKGNPTVPKH
ncbi:hypothetical protein L1887_60346 [Cichorium endivia]|nr:hypothetical protein L1887_60346 [Cichorium endivia]